MLAPVAAAAAACAVGALLLAAPAMGSAAGSLEHPAPAAQHAAAASPGRFAVGVRAGASLELVAARLGAVAGPGARVESLAPLRALIVRTAAGARLDRVPGVAWVERMRPRRRLAFVPNDPFAREQWYLDADRTFDYWSRLAQPPTLPAVRVAVVDSGIDLGHPDFKGRVAAARSFVGASVQDTDGHGTFVAGVIAAATNDGIGVAGMAFPAQLLVAKVVGRDGTISPEAEARAIRWAVVNGARVINMSIGGLRDPRDTARDTYSQLEAAAIAYAVAHGAVVVAAAGNADDAPATPWPYASYPAALPHVVGVAALTRSGDVSTFSDRDPVYVDLAAPGEGIVSTFPRSLTAQRPTCVEQGTSLCGPSEYHDAEGTSFAAPQVAAAIALVLSLRPSLTARQAATVVEQSATDVNGGTGCRRCPLLRDGYTGWGSLNIESALRSLAGPVPPVDPFEPNDDVAHAYPLWGLPRTVTAALDFWDDPLDVYSVRMQAGQALQATLDGPPGVQTELALWAARTTSLDTAGPAAAGYLLDSSARLTATQQVVAVVPKDGFYLVAVRAARPGSGAYRLTVSRAQP